MTFYISGDHPVIKTSWRRQKVHYAGVFQKLESGEGRYVNEKHRPAIQVIL